MFNSLKYVKQLEEAGVSREQAEVHLQIMTEIIETNLATKQDVKDLRTEINELRIEMRNGFVQLEQKMTIKLGSIVILGHGILFALLKLN